MRITQTTPKTCYLNLDLLNPGEIEHLAYRFPLVVDFPLENSEIIHLANPSNVGKTITHHPPVITTNRWYVYHSQSWVVYGIVLPTLY